MMNPPPSLHRVVKISVFNDLEISIHPNIVKKYNLKLKIQNVRTVNLLFILSK